MIMSPALRKAALTAHVTSSVGWLGSVTAFLALAVAGLASDDDQTVRAVYVAMEVLGWTVLVPLAVAALATGLAQSLGTPWGLFRHYWVLLKLAMTVLATAVLLLYTTTLTYLADAASQPATVGRDVGVLPSASPVLHSGAALIVLLVAACLSVYKPRGLTNYGWRKQQRTPRQCESPPGPRS